MRDLNRCYYVTRLRHRIIRIAQYCIGSLKENENFRPSGNCLESLNLPCESLILILTVLLFPAAVKLLEIYKYVHEELHITRSWFNFSNTRSIFPK